MAVLRHTHTDDGIQNYIATIGFFCVISCTILMLKLLGFKASLNILDGNKSISTVSVNGAYRASKGEFYNSDTLVEPPKRILPAVKLPPASKRDSTQRQSKSTSDLRQVQDLPPNLGKSTPEISQDPRGINNNRESADVSKLNPKDAKKQQNEQSKLDKKRLEEQKKRDKLAAQEQAKQEKIRKDREKLESQQRAKEAKRIEKENKAKSKNKGKGKAKADTPKPRMNPLAQGSQAPSPRAQPQGPSPPQGPSQPQGTSQATRPQYSTNTLESSISRTSGPPPYGAQDKAELEVVTNKSDNTGNTSFAKPADASGSSWDMIAQHREQINRKAFATGGRSKQTVLDLQFDAGGSDSTSEDKGSEV